LAQAKKEADDAWKQRHIETATTSVFFEVFILTFLIWNILLHVASRLNCISTYLYY
jgi:hypothetical protein